MKSFSLLPIVLSILAAFSTGPLCAAPTDPDLSFGDKGKVELSGIENPVLRSLPDNKILVMGSVKENDVNHLVLLRLLPNGKPDTSFGVAGKVATKLEKRFGGALAPDGKIIIGLRGGIARFQTDGKPDESWGTQGVASVENARRMEVQSDGKVVASCYPPLQDKVEVPPFLVRFNADGTRDAAFGEVKLPEGSETDYRINPFDDSILAYSSTGFSKEYIVRPGTPSEQRIPGLQISMWRFSSNGQLDTSFAKQGRLDWNSGSEFNFLRDINFRLDGFVVTAACTQPDHQWETPGNPYSLSRNIALFRVTKNGQVDTAWGTSGYENPRFRGQRISIFFAFMGGWFHSLNL